MSVDLIFHHIAEMKSWKKEEQISAKGISVKVINTAIKELAIVGTKLMESRGIVRTCAPLVSTLKNSRGTHAIQSRMMKMAAAKELRMNRKVGKTSDAIRKLQAFKFRLPVAKESAPGIVSPSPSSLPSSSSSLSSDTVPMDICTSDTTQLLPYRDRRNNVCAPEPPKGARLYTPKEAVSLIVEAENLGYGRSEIAALKQDMKKKGFLTKSISMLNRKVGKFRDNLDGLPEEWDMDVGRPKISDVTNQLVDRFEKAVEEREGKTWGDRDVGENMMDILTADSPAAATPSPESISANLGAIANIEGVTVGEAKPKQKHRDDGERSERSTLSDIAVQLFAQIIVDASGIPAGRALPADAPESVKKGLEIYSEAMGVPLEHLYFVDKHGLISTDDVGHYYYQGGNGAYNPKEQRVGGKNDDPSYSRHQPAAGSDACSGVVGRFTNSMAMAGFMAPIVLQFPNCSSKEVPMEEGFWIMEVKGLCIDGNINAGSDNVGYVAHICKGKKGAQENFFRWYSEKIEVPFTDFLRKKMGYKGGPVSLRHRIILAKDGAGPQIHSVMNEALAVARSDSQVIDLKNAKGRSGVNQPCDTGKGHKDEHSNAKKLSKEVPPSEYLKPELDAGYKVMEEMHDIKFDPIKLSNMKGMIMRSPTIKLQSYTVKSIEESFIKAAIRDPKTKSGYDVYGAFDKLLKRGTKEWKKERMAKWLRDLVVLVKEVAAKGYIEEETFARLGYDEDTDASGNPVPLTSSVTKAMHRQRASLPNSPYILQMINDAIQEAKEKEKESVGTENMTRDKLLKLGRQCEQEVNHFAARPADADFTVVAPAPIDCFWDRKKITKDMLNGFVVSRACATSSTRGAAIPKNKGTLEAAKSAMEKRRRDPNAHLLASESNDLVFRAWADQSKPVILEADSAGNEPDRMEVEEESIDPVSVRVNFGQTEPEKSASQLIDDDGWVNTCKSDLLGIVLQAPSALSKRAAWMFIRDNLHVCDAVAALAGHAKDDPKCVRSGMALLKSPLSGAYETVAEGRNASLMGAYLYYDPVTVEGFNRSGSACNGDGDRTMGFRNGEHKKGSMTSKLDDCKSNFYIRYPSKVGGHGKDIKWAYFDELVQHVAVGFTLENGVDNLIKEDGGIFVWSDRTINMVKETKMQGASMETKKLALVAYLFEIYYDLLLAPSTNVSRSAGLERFIGVFIN